MTSTELESVALKSLLDECIGLSRPATDVSPREAWFTTSKEFRIVGQRERLKKILLKLLSHGMSDPDYQGVKIWLSRSPVLSAGIRLGFRAALPWPAADEILSNSAEAKWVHLEYEDESNVYDLKDYGSGLQDESSPDKSTRFSVLWMDLGLCPQTHEHATEEGESALQSQQANHFRILYIEDNSANLCLVETALTHRDHVQLLKSSSAEEGIAVAMAEKPDLILLDINLPGMDGYEALYQLSNNPHTREIPVIAVSANAMGHDVERARKAGARDYLVKPYSINKLFELIDQWSGYDCEPLTA